MASKVTATLVALMLPCLRLLGKIIRMIIAGLWYVCYIKLNLPPRRAHARKTRGYVRPDMR